MSHREHRGFMLSELLVALFVLSIGLVGLVKMQISAVQRNAFSSRMTTAIAIAQRQMENLINQEFESTGGIFDPSTSPWPPPGSQLVIDPEPIVNPTLNGKTFNGYTLDWQVTANSPIDDVATLRVEVIWPGGSNPVSLVTIKRRS
jgi:type II secretory pathway pseudopilin PulG